MTSAAAPLIPMRLTAIHYAASGTNTYEFTPLDGQPLPHFTAGAHVDIHLPNGLVRQYSLCNPQGETHRYVVGVKRDPHSRGGSLCIHDDLRAGAVVCTPGIVGSPKLSM